MTLPIFTRILSKEDYGALALAEIYSICINALSWACLEAAYERNFFEYRQDKEKSAQLIYSVAVFALTNFIIFSAVTFLIKGFLAQLIFREAKYADILFYAFCGMFFVRFNEFCLIYFKNSEDAKRYSKYQVVFTIANMGMALFLVAVLKTGSVGIVAAQFIAALGISFLLVRRLLSIFPFDFNWKMLKEALWVGLPLLPNTFFKIVGTRIDAIMVSILASLGGVGLYNIGQKIANMGFAIMTALDHVFKPETYRLMFDAKEEGPEAIGRYLTPFIFIATGFSLFISLFAYEIITLLTPASYHAASPIVMVLSMYCAILFFGKINPLQLIYAKKPHVLTFMVIGSYVLNILVNIPFVYKWGAIGSAWATFLANLISGSMVFVVAQKYYNIQWEYKKIAAIFGLLFTSFLGVLLLMGIGIAWPVLLLVKTFLVVVYVCLGMRLQILTKENLQVIRKIFVSVRI